MNFLARFVLAICPLLCSAATADGNSTPIAVLQYRLDNEHMIDLQVKINGESAWFCLDSGDPHSIIDPRFAKRLKLPITNGGTITGTGKDPVSRGHTSPVTIQVGPAEIKVDEPWVVDLSSVPIAKDVEGLIGYELFDNFVVQIDPIAHELRLFDPQHFSPGRLGTSLPLIVENRKLYIEIGLDVKPGLSEVHRVRVDTGAEESVADAIVSQSLETRTTTLGNGLGGNFKATSGVFEAIHIGPYTIRHVWGPGAKQSTVGMEILRRFTSTFDAHRGIIQLIPNETLLEPVPEPAASD